MEQIVSQLNHKDLDRIINGISLPDTDYLNAIGEYLQTQDDGKVSSQIEEIFSSLRLTDNQKARIINNSTLSNEDLNWVLNVFFESILDNPPEDITEYKQEQKELEELFQTTFEWSPETSEFKAQVDTEHYDFVLTHYFPLSMWNNFDTMTFNKDVFISLLRWWRNTRWFVPEPTSISPSKF